jgi:hypothetical protein
LFEETEMAARFLHVFLIGTLALTACATSREPSAEVGVNAPGSRIVVAPLNLAIRTPEEISGKSEPVWRELLSYFQTLDRQVTVIESGSADQLLLEAMLDLDVSDPDSALRIARSRFARALAEHRDYDLLIVPSLVLRPGRLRGRYAIWDGVQRAVPNGAEVASNEIGSLAYPPGSITVLGLRGTIAAISLHVSVLHPDGTHVYEGLGGLDLIQEARRENPWEGRWTFETRMEPFTELGHLREGIECAFERPSVATARSRGGMTKQLHLSTDEK